MHMYNRGWRHLQKRRLNGDSWLENTCGEGEECPKEKKLHIPSSDEAFQIFLVAHN